MLRSISIVAVARNEQEKLPSLLNSLTQLDYPSDLFEIILVDDCSSDETYLLMESYSRERENVRSIKVKEAEKDLPGKKAGLQRALEAARNDMLLLTDADCVVSPEWLQDTASYWDDETKMLVGYAPEDYSKLIKEASPDKRITYTFRRFSQIVNGGIFAATIGLGKPFSCYGRNLAVDRNLFLQAGGYQQMKDSKAGDDKQALNLLSKQPGKVKYSPVRNVTTYPNLQNYREQQKRRFGKLGMSSPLYYTLTFIVFGFFIYLPFRVFIMADYYSFLIFYLAALLVWLINLYKHRERFFLLDLLFLVVYPYFMIYYTLLGFKGDWQWKN